MLTVDFERLDISEGDLVLDMGAGAGRHSFECHRRGANVVSLDYDYDELPEVGAIFAAMREAGEASENAAAACINGDALRLPFADDTFDLAICSEVFEHISGDTAAMAELFRVLKPGALLAATVPAWLPEKICWALSAEYHAPLSEGGHVRIYTEKQFRTRLEASGFHTEGSERAHALHSAYWWLRCLVGPTNDTNPAVKAYHELLVWDMMKAPFITRTTESILNPVLGKSMVVYARKPGTSPPKQPSTGQAVKPRAAASVKKKAPPRKKAASRG